MSNRETVHGVAGHIAVILPQPRMGFEQHPSRQQTPQRKCARGLRWLVTHDVLPRAGLALRVPSISSCRSASSISSCPHEYF